MTKLKPYTLSALYLLLFVFSIDAYAQLRFDKPKTEPPLDNPYLVGVPREDVIKTAIEVLKTCSIPIDEELSRPAEGKIVTKNIVFTRGVTTKNDLEHLAIMPAGEVRNWQQGRCSLEISAMPVNGKKSQIMVIAHIQGKISDALRSNQWIDGQSNGVLEDQVLRGLASKVLGIDLSVKTGDNKRRILSCEY